MSIERCWRAWSQLFQIRPCYVSSYQHLPVERDLHFPFPPVTYFPANGNSTVRILFQSSHFYWLLLLQPLKRCAPHQNILQSSEVVSQASQPPTTCPVPFRRALKSPWSRAHQGLEGGSILRNMNWGSRIKRGT